MGGQWHDGGRQDVRPEKGIHECGLAALELAEDHDVESVLDELLVEGSCGVRDGGAFAMVGELGETVERLAKPVPLLCVGPFAHGKAPTSASR